MYPTAQYPAQQYESGALNGCIKHWNIENCQVRQTVSQVRWQLKNVNIQ